MDQPKLAFISAKLTRHSTITQKNQPGRKPEHTEALLEDAARQLNLFEENNGNEENSGTSDRG